MSDKTFEEIHYYDPAMSMAEILRSAPGAKMKTSDNAAFEEAVAEKIEIAKAKAESVEAT